MLELRPTALPAEWRRGLLYAAQAVEQFPQRCPLAPESGPGLEIRQLVYGRYRVLFTITLDTVCILHIRHGARQRLQPEANDEPNDT